MNSIANWTLIFLLSLIPQIALGQYTAVSCEDFGFDTLMYDEDGDISTGIDGKEFDMFSLYKAAGERIPDCMIYKSENNQDYVIVPTGWVTDPEKNFQTAILALLEAMTKSRDEFRKYGEVNKDWYFLFGGNAPDGDAWTYNFDKECWMRSIKWPDNKESIKFFKQTVAHEGGHCFSLESLRESPHNYRSWVEESSAEYLSTLVYPAYNQEHQSSVSFQLASIMRQKYNAYLLMEYYAHIYSDEAAIDLIKVMLNKNIDLRPRLRSMGYDRLLQETYFYHYQGELPDSGGGFIPREATVEYKGSTITLDPDENQFSIPALSREQLSLFKLRLPEGYDLELYPPVDSSAKAYFSIIAGSQRYLEWDSRLDIEGNCEGDQYIDLLASHLNVNNVTGTKVKYLLKERTGCCGTEVTIGPNPEDKDLPDGSYEFDYYIRSTVSYMGEGESETFPLNYYVNSKDGSMMFTKSWFTEMFGTTEANGMKLDAMIMLANGQMVGYVFDTNFGKKRAITIDANQTSGNIMRTRTLNAAELFRNGRGASVSPDPLPFNSRWSGNTTAYSYMQPEKNDPNKRNHLTAYISNQTTGIRSPMSQFGFMTGHIKDNQGRSKELAFLQMVTEKGDWFKVHLDHMERRCASYTASGYEKMTLGSSTGAIAAMSEGERNDFADSQMDLNNQILLLIREMADCGDNKACVAEVEKRMMELERQKQDAVYNLPGDSNMSGSAGSDLQQQQKAIRDEMYAIHEQIIDKEVHCDRLSRSNANCGGCMEMAVERCDNQLEDMKSQLDQLECKMAKLHGMGDVMDDCE